MYFNIFQRLTRTCIRQIHTSVLRNLMKDHSDRSFRKNIRSTTFYWAGIGILAVGLSYSAVPLYRIFCQSYSYGGTISAGHDTSKVSTMSPINRKIKVKFSADTAASMQWNFKPQQTEITVVPGETALAFYTATNPTNKQVVGISTYNVIPFEVGQYFNKIQCFCFEEQMLNPHEQVDMPVFFYIDPEFDDDPKMEFVNEVILSYTFFEAKPGFKLPIPSYVKSHSVK
ncbi:cytochrome c oxidase assembly protein COX11, mitochondrial [Camponotus floridanus]|nr:cytochrome c oxidase assembly protein COX11, mitochondrial [Camponotus floridanus]XP_011251839.1 cytochrome c oxidase assembly protein COX11, mitochondrial [Camponotus floridanus]XP_025269953.1 cytochrome c oxidase assembly protein COX11, mitochondrial [Camponotus floridanus]